MYQFCLFLSLQLDVANSELEVYMSTYKKLQERYEQAKENSAKAKVKREENQRYVVYEGEYFKHKFYQISINYTLYLLVAYLKTKLLIRK